MIFRTASVPLAQTHERAGRSRSGRDRSQDAPSYEPFSTRHTFSGVTGMSMWVTPTSLKASTTAFITDGSAPAQPASPQPLTPKRLVLHGTEWFSIEKSGASEARGRA